MSKFHENEWLLIIITTICYLMDYPHEIQRPIFNNLHFCVQMTPYVT